jgi:membrane-associated phospholipid phosphatase
MRDFDRTISELACVWPPGIAERTLAALVSPWGATAQGVVAAAALRRAGRPAIPALVAVPLTILLGRSVKKLVSRPRPGISRFERKGRQSFPSTHVAGPAALVACLWRLSPRTTGWRVSLILGSAITVGVARERVAAKKHWPSDVVAGLALGAVVGALVGSAGALRGRGATGASRGQMEGAPR